MSTLLKNEKIAKLLVTIPHNLRENKAKPALEAKIRNSLPELQGNLIEEEHSELLYHFFKTSRVLPTQENTPLAVHPPTILCPSPTRPKTPQG